MTATVGTNSYVNESEADTYFADKFGYDNWGTATSANKNASLVSATQQLDLLCSWYGYKTDTDQLLAFPRLPDADPVPQAVKDAQCEIAYGIITSGSTSIEGGDPLTELKAGSVTLKFDAGSTPNPIINDLATKLLSQYGLCSGTGSTKIVQMVRG